MKVGLGLGITAAIVLHGGVILFGGLLFPHAKKDQGTLQQVELLSEDEALAKEKEPEETKAEASDELKADTEEAPDAAEMIKNLELSAAPVVPELEAASLSAIEAALSGQAGGGGDFAEALDFASGGRIGGTGKAGTIAQSLDSAFDLAEMDQKPRAVFQSAPTYPAAMRGKKVEAVVTVVFVVDATGKVTDPRVESSSHAAFDKPALAAVKNWKFEPGIRGGQAAPCKMRVPIRFPPS